jgi:hypothetical protein
MILSSILLLLSIYIYMVVQLCNLGSRWVINYAIVNSCVLIIIDRSWFQIPRCFPEFDFQMVSKYFLSSCCVPQGSHAAV